MNSESHRNCGTRRQIMLKTADAAPAIVLLLMMGLLSYAELRQLQTPPPRPDTAPAVEFSAERAMAHLRVLATESRAVGTSGHEAARVYLVEQVREMGLQPVVQNASSIVRFAGSPGFSAGAVQNVLARVPGQNNTGAIVVNAHYDSGTTGPGASDCGSCVVTALETLRALRAGPPLRNDVIFVFSDAEEEGDLGAAAFAQSHPWAESVKLVVNYEAQGSGGASILYATSNEDGWLIDEFLRTTSHVRAYSWIGAIMELYPQGQLECDLAEYTKRGKQGLGFVYLANTADYHTVRDNIDRIDPGSIQQEGDYTMAFLRHFGNADLTDPPRGDNQVFFSVPGGFVVHYPYAWAFNLSILTTLLIVAVIVAGFRFSALRPGRVLAATGGLGLGVIAAVTVGVLLWVGIKQSNPDYQVSLIGSYQSDIYTVAFIGLSVASVSLLYALMHRLGRLNLFGAVLVLWLPLHMLMSYATPAMSYIATWPLLFGTLPLAWGVWTGRHIPSRPWRTSRWVQVGVLSVAAAPSLILLPATLYQALGLLHRFEGATGLPLFGIMTLFVIPTGLLLIPQFDLLAGHAARYRWYLPAFAAMIAAGLIGWGYVTSDFDAERPRPSHISYALNADRGDAQWISFDRHLGPWTSGFFPPGTEPVEYETVTWGPFQAYTAHAPFQSLPGPEAEIETDSVAHGKRVVTMRLSSLRDAPYMRVRVQAFGPIRAARLNGQVMDLTSYTWAHGGMLQFNYANTPDTGLTLTLVIDSPDALTLLVTDETLGLPQHVVDHRSRRPRNTMPTPIFPRDATSVMKRYTL